MIGSRNLAARCLRSLARKTQLSPGCTRTVLDTISPRTKTGADRSPINENETGVEIHRVSNVAEESNAIPFTADAAVGVRAS
jgi:hypothetical protein